MQISIVREGRTNSRVQTFTPTFVPFVSGKEDYVRFPQSLFMDVELKGIREQKSGKHTTYTEQATARPAGFATDTRERRRELKGDHTIH